MPELPMEAWLAFGIIAAAAVLALLYSVATAVRVETHIHDTRIKARDLKRAYAAQLAELEAKKALDQNIEIVGQGPIDPFAQAA